MTIATVWQKHTTSALLQRSFQNEKKNKKKLPHNIYNLNLKFDSCLAKSESQYDSTTYVISKFSHWSKCIRSGFRPSGFSTWFYAAPSKQHIEGCLGLEFP